MARRRAGCSPEHMLAVTLYRRATIDSPVHGTYGVVPVRPANRPHARFARPAVRLSTELINPTSTCDPRRTGSGLPVNAVRLVWEALRDQIVAQDLALATALAIPTCQPIPHGQARLSYCTGSVRANIPARTREVMLKTERFRDRGANRGPSKRHDDYAPRAAQMTARREVEQDRR